MAFVGYPLANRSPRRVARERITRTVDPIETAKQVRCGWILRLRLWWILRLRLWRFKA